MSVGNTIFDRVPYHTPITPLCVRFHERFTREFPSDPCSLLCDLITRVLMAVAGIVIYPIYLALLWKGSVAVNTNSSRLPVQFPATQRTENSTQAPSTTNTRPSNTNGKQIDDLSDVWQGYAKLYNFPAYKGEGMYVAFIEEGNQCVCQVGINESIQETQTKFKMQMQQRTEFSPSIVNRSLLGSDGKSKIFACQPVQHLIFTPKGNGYGFVDYCKPYDSKHTPQRISVNPNSFFSELESQGVKEGMLKKIEREMYAHFPIVFTNEHQKKAQQYVSESLDRLKQIFEKSAKEGNCQGRNGLIAVAIQMRDEFTSVTHTCPIHKYNPTLKEYEESLQDIQMMYNLLLWDFSGLLSYQDIVINIEQLVITQNGDKCDVFTQTRTSSENESPLTQDDFSPQGNRDLPSAEVDIKNHILSLNLKAFDHERSMNELLSGVKFKQYQSATSAKIEAEKEPVNGPKGQLRRDIAAEWTTYAQKWANAKIRLNYSGKGMYIAIAGKGKSQLVQIGIKAPWQETQAKLNERLNASKDLDLAAVSVRHLFIIPEENYICFCEPNSSDLQPFITLFSLNLLSPDALKERGVNEDLAKEIRHEFLVNYPHQWETEWQKAEYEYVTKTLDRFKANYQEIAKEGVVAMGIKFKPDYLGERYCYVRRCFATQQDYEMTLKDIQGQFNELLLELQQKDLRSDRVQTTIQQLVVKPTGDKWELISYTPIHSRSTLNNTDLCKQTKYTCESNKSDIDMHLGFLRERLDALEILRSVDSASLLDGLSF